MKLVVATAVLSVAWAWAQEPLPPAAPDAPAASQEGSDDSPVSRDRGPRLISRGGGPSLSDGQPVGLIPFISLNGVYDSGLSTTSVNSEGTVPYVTGYGLEATFGVTGNRRWRHTALDLDYRGSARHYTQRSYYDGMDNSLQLGFKHFLSARTYFEVTANASRYQRAYNLPMAGYYGTGFEAYNPGYSGLTTNDFFDSPTNALIGAGRLIHEHSPRLSFSVGANGFFVRRRSSALIGTTGYTTTGDVAYRLSRYQSIALEYTFSHFDFKSSFGQSDMNGASLNYSIRLGRHTEVAIQAGAFRVESLRLRTVQFDPAIAILLGRSFGFEKFHGVAYAPRMGAHITRSFRKATFSVGYDRTVLAGNGVYATSSYESGQLGYSYGGFRRLTFQWGADYHRFSAMTQDLGRYRGFATGVGFGYRLGRGISFIARGDVRRFYISNSPLNRVYGRTVVGFSWSPGEYPLALW